MADMHVLDADDNGKFQVVMHFDVPVGNNQASVAFSTILVNAGRNTTILIDGNGNGGTISVAEKTAIQNGTVREHVVSLPIESAGKTLIKTREALREFYASEKIRSNDALQRRLPWFGRNESEA